MKLTTPRKIAIAVVLGLLVAWLFGCQKPCTVVVASRAEHYVDFPFSANDTDLPYLQKIYEIYNTGYFHDRLLKNPKIEIVDDLQDAMATTICDVTVTDCTVKFTLKYVRAPRVARYTILHEMCHIKTWNKDLDFLGVQQDHGRIWRSCMLQLDMEGAFREIMIDNYVEEMSVRVK